MSGLMNLFAIIVVFGLVMWLVNAYIPMPSAIKSLLNILVMVVLVIYVLEFFGLIGTILPLFKILH